MAATLAPQFTKKIIDTGSSTLNLCFQCGTCTGSCASGRFTAFRTRKVIRMAQLGIKDVLSSEDLWACTTCYTCYERCPRTVEIPDIILAIRNQAVRAAFMAEAHKKNAQSLAKTGHMIPMSDQVKAMRTKLGLGAQPDTTLMNPDAMEQVRKIMKETDFLSLVGEK